MGIWPRRRAPLGSGQSRINGTLNEIPTGTGASRNRVCLQGSDSLTAWHPLNDSWHFDSTAFSRLSDSFASSVPPLFMLRVPALLLPLSTASFGAHAFNFENSFAIRKTVGYSVRSKTTESKEVNAPFSQATVLLLAFSCPCTFHPFSPADIQVPVTVVVDLPIYLFPPKLSTYWRVRAPSR